MTFWVEAFWAEVEDLAQKFAKEDLQNGDLYPAGYYVCIAQEEALSHLLQRKIEETLLKLGIDPRFVRFSFGIYKGHLRGFAKVLGPRGRALEILARLQAQLEPQAEPREVGASNPEEVRI